MFRFVLLSVLVAIAVSDLFQDAEDLKALGNMEDLLFKEEKEMIYSKPVEERNAEAVLDQFNSVRHSPMNVQKLEKYLKELEAADQQVTRALSHEEIARRISKIKEILERRQAKCDESRFSFRSIDGSCNNIDERMQGATGATLLKVLENAYDDGLNTPRTKSAVPGPNGPKDLPSARNVSRVVFGNRRVTNQDLTALTMHFGQITDHDFAAVHGQDVDCSNCVTVPAECFPILLPPDEDVFLNKSCFKFIRSEFLHDASGVRQHVNSITSYLDASFVYGSTASEAIGLRVSGEGTLKRSNNSLEGSELLPPHVDLENCAGTDAQNGIFCGLAGDGRAAEQPGLTAMHTMFLREHNRIARKLKALNLESLGPDKIYNISRKIVGAEWQHILYNEFLPLIIDAKRYNEKDLGFKSPYSYDANMDASVSNMFAAAAFRFGHTLVPFELKRVAGDLNQMYPSVKLREAFFNATYAYDSSIPDGPLDSFIRGMLVQDAFDVDGQFADALTNNLFGKPNMTGSGMDLTALNIQRARDQGLPSFMEIRRFCNLSTTQNFNQLDVPADAKVALRAVYGNNAAEDIDAFVGLVLEKPITDTKVLVGETLSCVFADQFTRSKFGDRYFYLNDDQFTPGQIAEIKKATMSRLICDNIEGVQEIQTYAFAKAKVFGDSQYASFSEFVDETSWPTNDLLSGLDNRRRLCSEESMIPKVDHGAFI